MKTAHITESLDLSAEEAALFWPIYNEFSKTAHQLRRVETRAIRKKITAGGGIDTFSNSESNKILADLIRIDEDLYIAKKKMTSNLKKVISTKKIIKLYKTEQEFNRRLLKRLRGKGLKK